MRLVDDWRFVLTSSHSMWAFFLGVLAFNSPDLIYALAGVDTDPAIWTTIGNALFAYGILGRITKQDETKTNWRMPFALIFAAVVTVLLSGMGPYPDKTDGKEPVGISALSGPPSEADWAAVVIPLVSKWEGLRTTAYLDMIAEPDVWTVCYGETRNVGPGDSYTAEQCATMLQGRLREYRAGWHGYLTPVTLSSRLTPQRDAAYTSLAYNVGIGGAGGSTATRRLNAGDITGACDAIGWWNKAGSRVIRGLVNRRAEETALCLEGI